MERSNIKDTMQELQLKFDLNDLCLHVELTMSQWPSIVCPTIHPSVSSSFLYFRLICFLAGCGCLGRLHGNWLKVLLICFIDVNCQFVKLFGIFKCLL